jgi:hypothetical protein
MPLVEPDGLDAGDSLELRLIEHHPGLPRLDRDVADLVERQSALVCRLESSRQVSADVIARGEKIVAPAASARRASPSRNSREVTPVQVSR